ncbi:hypothetical protein BCR42DRAFT_395970 [Absidia repens]|uniref:EF-hand domain-containing protein n=1 Tax=Absidia repens TaxID=90262 RepID=A0A1X2I6G1_9FUNG|nr:hypothetical protein BCR42DRAFT_395970 [Absidia repens]
MTSSKAIPPFFFPNGHPTSHVEQEQRRRKILAIVKHLYGYRPYLTEACFIAVTKSCGLPRYMNMALFRKMVPSFQENRIAYAQFVHSWIMISKDRYDDESLFFSVLKKHGHDDVGEWLTPDDFLPVLQVETVICRLFYDAECSNGRMTLKQFRKSKFTDRVKTLGSCTELNNANHDLMITENNLIHYNDGCLSPRIVHRIIQCGRIATFSRETPTNSLSFLDFIWFLLNEVDKTSPKAIEYWFRCMDEDGDGILSSYELENYWNDQIARQISYSNDIHGKSNHNNIGDAGEDWMEEDLVRFDDILRQMNDLIQPQHPGQFRLQDLKRNGFLAERFFDTFLHFNKFQIHESHQGSLRLKLQLEMEKIRSVVSSPLDQRSLLHGALLDDAHFGYLMFSDWSEFAEAEYQQLLMAEHHDATNDDVHSEGDIDENDNDDDDDDDDDDVVVADGIHMTTNDTFATPHEIDYLNHPSPIYINQPFFDDRIGNHNKSHDIDNDDTENETDEYTYPQHYHRNNPTSATMCDSDTPTTSHHSRQSTDDNDDNDSDGVLRCDHTSDLEEESDSAPPTPTSTSKDGASSSIILDSNQSSERQDPSSSLTWHQAIQSSTETKNDKLNTNHTNNDKPEDQDNSARTDWIWQLTRQHVDRPLDQ